MYNIFVDSAVDEDATMDNYVDSTGEDGNDGLDDIL